MNIKLEDLEINNYKIFQDKDSFNFGIDAVLLANFVLRESAGAINFCDFCTGNLPIPLIIYAKRNKFLSDEISIKCFEIDKEQVELCNKSIEYNANIEKSIKSNIKVVNDDIKNIYLNRDKYKNIYEYFDVVTCNPPYMKKGSALVNVDDKKIVARHEIYITFDEICKAASMVLKSNKKFFIIHHTERFTELSNTLIKNGFQIKKVAFIHPFIDKPSNLVLIEAVKNANYGVKVLEPIVIYNNDGTYTDKVVKIYGK